MKNTVVRFYKFLPQHHLAINIVRCLLLAVHPAERHTTAAAGADGLYDAARCFPAASDDAAPRG